MLKNRNFTKLLLLTIRLTVILYFWYKLTIIKCIVKHN